MIENPVKGAMNGRRLLGWSLCIGLLLSLGAGSVQAQRTLEIRDGQIWLDGRRVTLTYQTRQLDLSPGLTLQLQFYGEESPIFSLNGRFFQVRGSRIVPVHPTELLDQEIFIPAISSFEDTTDRMEALMAELIKQARALQEEAERVYQSVEHWRQVRTSELEQRLETIRRQAAALSRQVRLLPRLEWETYLMHMQRQDAELARRLVEEWTWEQELQRQALRIRQMPEGPDREAAIAELRRQLEETFERKQQNRRREIAQLERQLRLLRERLNERERYRRRIIEQRLRELLGGQR
ncbi:hypothetical protein SAMN04488087_2031 [Rhodothermus profundi]|uniref:Uncharacterized protein n=2 Tax=Rhodothermus profundi TaxID=633813 RepID=A0A1M6VHA8_9BACT|nr:hypothetical protein SAMN04488087_2031 [Rhodothermus profundi]